MMNDVRYSVVRLRIFKLFNILNNRIYSVWMAPQARMSVEELRGREEYTREGFSNDYSYYVDQHQWAMTIPQLIDCLPNLSTDKIEMGFAKATEAVIEIYESIQEYIGLWCELMDNAPEFKTPPLDELKKLEALARYLFPVFKQIKPFVQHESIAEQMAMEATLNSRGLLGLASLFGYDRNTRVVSFYSHLDSRDPVYQQMEYNLPGKRIETPVIQTLPFNPSNDSVLATEAPRPSLGDWTF